MYVDKEQAINLLKEKKQDFNRVLEENTSNLQKILYEDDWSFVIKMHAYLEAMVTDLIVTHISDIRIRNTIERLPLSDEKAGKLKMAKDLELLSKEERSFIKKFSELRNELAHKVSNIDFTFEDYLSKLDKNQKKSWSKTYSWFAKEEDKEFYQSAVLKAPKSIIMLGVFVMSGLHAVKNFETIARMNLKDLSEETMKELLSE